MKIIAVDIDNVLNDFSDTLSNTVFEYDDSYGLTHEQFNQYLILIKQNAVGESDLLTTKFSDFRYRIHAQCYNLAKANLDGVAFMNWLKEHNWQIVICTQRNLKLAGECTKSWLTANHIPYDYLVMALNKIVFCKLWDIPYLVDDDILNITYGEQYGIQVYYPIKAMNDTPCPATARGFVKFEEIIQWIQK